MILVKIDKIVQTSPINCIVPPAKPNGIFRWKTENSIFAHSN